MATAALFWMALAGALQARAGGPRFVTATYCVGRSGHSDPVLYVVADVLHGLGKPERDGVARAGGRDGGCSGSDVECADVDAGD